MTDRRSSGLPTARLINGCVVVLWQTNGASDHQNGSTNVTSDVVVRENIGNLPKHQIQVEDVTAEFS